MNIIRQDIDIHYLPYNLVDINAVNQGKTATGQKYAVCMPAVIEIHLWSPKSIVSNLCTLDPDYHMDKAYVLISFCQAEDLP